MYKEINVILVQCLFKLNVLTWYVSVEEEGTQLHVCKKQNRDISMCNDI